MVELVDKHRIVAFEVLEMEYTPFTFSFIEHVLAFYGHEIEDLLFISYLLFEFYEMLVYVKLWILLEISNPHELFVQHLQSISFVVFKNQLQIILFEFIKIDLAFKNVHAYDICLCVVVGDIKYSIKAIY